MTWVHLEVYGNRHEFSSMADALDFIKWRLMRARVKRVLALEAQDFFLALFGLDQQSFTGKGERETG